MTALQDLFKFTCFTSLLRLHSFHTAIGAGNRKKKMAEPKINSNVHFVTPRTTTSRRGKVVGIKRTGRGDWYEVLPEGVTDLNKTICVRLCAFH